MKKFFLLFLLSFAAFKIKAQGVGINTDGSSPDASALLDVKATDRGVLVPRVSLSNVTSASPVSSPATGLLVYNTNASVTGGNGSGFYFWTGSAWARLDNSNSGDWRLTGNAGTSPSTNFLGTTDAQDLVFRTNNTERLRIAGAGTTQTELRMAGTTSNLILYNTNGVAAPSTGTRSVGTKAVWFPQLSGTDVDYATGIEGSTLWHSLPGATSAYQHRFYGGTQRLMDIRGNNQTLLYGAGDNTFTAPTSGFTTLNVEGSIFMPSGNSLWIGNTADVNDRLRLHQTGTDSYIDYATGFLQFRSGTTERVRFTATGRVGIGTTTPVQLLDVNGRMAVQNGVIQRGTSEINVTNDLGLYSQINGHWIRIASNAAPIKFFTDQGGGNSAGTNAIMAIDPNNGGGIQINAEISGTGNAAVPPGRAALDVTSTSKGILIPRLTRAQRDAMGNTLNESLLIFNTEDDCFQFWDTKATPNGGNGFWNSLCEWCKNVIIISSNQTGYNLATAVGGGRAETYCVYINSGVTLQAAGNGGGSGAAGNPGFNSSTMPAGAKITLFNYGTILAGGGNGGQGGRESDGVCESDQDGFNGGRGGDAILTSSTVPVRVYNYGLIRAGGGGGGGGRGGCCSGGGPGGGGAGTPVGSVGAGNRGRCVRNTICFCTDVGTSFPCTNTATATTGGAGCPGGTSGSSGCPGTGSGTGSTGGSGGNAGAAGNPGTTSHGCCGSGCVSGSGGGAGLALNGNGSGSSLTTMPGGTTVGGINP